jgi:hypothetical protein
MLTAKQALDKKQITDDEKAQKAVERLLEAIELRAPLATSIFTGRHYKEDGDIWVQGGYMPTATHAKACQLLRDLGYTVYFHYVELQLVDMFTIISWGVETAEEISKKRELASTRGRS